MARSVPKFSISNLSHKSLILIVFLLLIAIVSLLKFLPHQQVSAAWFNDAWMYRKAISITNSGSATTNQYVKITLDTAALISADKLQNNCNDLRLTNINGKLLTHFVDGNPTYACNTNQTSIYILVDSIPSSGTTLYVYYGNPSAPNIEPQLGSDQNPGLSCKNILQHRSDNKGTQKYYITPTGNLANKIQVNCDMTYSSGGWIQVWHGLPSEAFVDDSTHETINLSNNIIFNEMRVEGTNLNFNVIDTVTQTAMLGSTIRTYFKQVNDAPDVSSPRVAFHNLSGVQNINLTNNYFLYGYGNDWRFFYSCVDVESINYIYLGGCAPGVPPRNTFNSTSVGCVGGGNNDYCDNARNTTPKDSGLNLSLYQYQESSVYVRETTITLNISQSMGTIATEEVGGGPIAYWKFDEGIGTSTRDSVHNTIATFNGTPSWQTEEQCNSGRCINFNSNGYLTAPDSTVLKYDNSWSISTWVNLHDTSGVDRIIVGKQGGHGGIIWLNGNLAFRIYDGSSSWVNITYTPQLNQWYYLTATWNATNHQAQFFVNGKSVGTGGGIGSIFGYANTLYIGGDSYGVGYYTKSNIDDVKVYPYARTASQIKSDYAAGKAHSSSNKGTSANLGGNNKSGDFLSDGLVGYWKMDEASGNVLDSSGNNNTGTPTNTSVVSGKYGNSRNFTSNTNYINTPITNGSTVTISAWATLTAQSTMLWNRQSGAGPDLYFTDNQIYLNVWDGGGNPFCSIPANANDGQFHHYVTIISPTNTALYYDGQLCGKAAYRDPTGAFIISSGAGYDWNGKIDEVRVYNRALSPSEVSQLYNWAPGPLMYWNLEEGSGSTITDKSGNNYNSNTFNNPTWTSGKYGKALAFDGDDTVNFTFAQTLPAMTISAWVNPSSYSTWRAIVQTAATGDRALYLNNSYLQMYSACNSSIPVPLNTWSYVTATVDSSDYVTYYINGVNAGGCTSVSNPRIIEYFHISGQNTGDGENWRGKIDDVKIYNYARTQKQIVEDMNAGHPAGGSPVGSQVGYWKFDEGYGTIANNSGNQGSSLNGTLYGTPVWTKNGKFNKALSFDASDDYVDASNVASLTFGSGQSFTYGAWIYSKNPLGRWQGVVYHGDSGQSQGHLGLNPSGQLSGGTGDGSSWQTHETSYLIPQNTWVYIAMALDRNSNIIKFYANGVEVGSYSHSYVPSAPSISLRIGDGNTGGSEHFNGLIDEVKIYNYALTSDEIKIDYNRGSAIAMGDSSLSPYGSSSTNYGSSCSDILNKKPGTSDGVYWIKPTSVSSPYQVYCDMTTDGGGWTLLMKAEGNTNTFNYDANYWTTSNTLNPTDLVVNNTSEAKYDSFNNLPITQVRATWPETNHKMITTVNQNTPLTIFQTTNDLGVDVSQLDTVNFPYQTGYQHYGFNLTCAGQSKVRWGWMFNNESTCDSNDVSAGIGLMNVSSTTNGGWSTCCATNKAVGGYPFRVRVWGRDVVEASSSQGSAPIAEWKMEEGIGSTVYDTSGNNYNGVLVNSPTWTTGKIGKALNFTASNYVNLPTLPTINEPYTLSYWFFPTSLSGFQPAISLAGSNSYPKFGLNGDKLLAYAGGEKYRYGAKTFTAGDLNKWWYATYVINNQNDLSTWKVYLNGQESSGSVGANTGNYYAPSSPGQISNGIVGKIDHVQIYNYARTPAQIAYDYNRGAPIGWWKFDECQGNTANDSSGNNNSGTINIGSGGSQNSLGTCQIGTSAAWTNGASGKYNSSLNFDGTDDWLDLHDPASGIFDFGTNDFSIGVFFKTNTVGNNGCISNPILKKGDLGATSYAIGIDWGNMRFWVNGTSVGYSYPTDNQWHQIVAVRKSNQILIYDNGVLKSQTNSTATNIDNGDGLGIGKAYCAGPANGQIDDVRIYNYALTSTQVKTLYNNGAVSFN